MVMEPHQANVFGTIHGGEIMRIMDTTAGWTAIKYARRQCVTARVDEFQFLRPINISDFVTCTGTVVYTGNTSIEIRVTLDTENLQDRGSKGRAIEAFFTYVALGENGRPVPIPPFVPESDREKELYEYVKQRRAFDQKRREEARQRAAQKQD